MSKLGGFDLLAQETADLAYQSVMRLRDVPIGNSPIEHLFFAALVTVARTRNCRIERIWLVRPPKSIADVWELALAQNANHEIAVVETQVKIAGWCVDFVLHYAAGDGQGGSRLNKLLVECDGHDFHERTKLQAARDRARDRAAQHEGLPILRFTGSELWADPAGCAEQVVSFMERS